MVEGNADQEINLGHLVELNVRETRLASDEVHRTIIPKLSPLLAEGKLSPRDALEINQVYFRSPGIAGTDRNLTFLTHSQVEDVSNVLSAKLNTDDRGIRKVDVFNSHFHHAGKESLARLANRAFNELNTFVTSSNQLTDRQIRLQISKFYLLFSALHLPHDGSGRFSGDLDTTIQEAVKLKLAETNRQFQIQHISTNGWRSIESNDEGTMMSREREFDRALLQNSVLPHMNEIDPVLTNQSSLNNVIFDDDPQKANIQMQEIATTLENTPALLELYQTALEKSLSEVVVYDPTTGNTEWLNASIIRTMNARRNGKTSEDYISSETLPIQLVEKTDTLVALLNTHSYDLLTDMLSDTNFVDTNILDIREIPYVIHKILLEVEHFKPALYEQIINLNPSMKRLSQRKRL